ncbi:ABC transporter ATP-binding protein [Neopusillimonas aromaticivorans]|uniref:ABC transporter ATP-binding protein n=1 Tax=Neopusillimonas aromaticivorans TaxID=2979868 RepID=UPI002593F882|nr:ABC transporter ATP-binding protein [Neopusillimonas aromaticivorans]WJJ94890.1 ABC transporter ATP-binding protein [Neopusillimonas aromaticivorans]
MSESVLLNVQGLQAGYGSVQVLHNLSLSIRRGEIVSIVGANGAGKSTFLNTLSGVVKPWAGTVTFAGKPLNNLSAAAIARNGLRQVPESRRMFADLSVQDNLRLGGYGRKQSDLERDLALVYDLFPRLRERMQQAAGTLSGGEQQMVAIGRAMMGRPELLMLDEPSMGLAPLITAEIFRLIGVLQREMKIAILLVEQNARAALKMSDRAFVLSLGQFIIEGEGRTLLEDPRIQEAFLGGHAASNKGN